MRATDIVTQANQLAAPGNFADARALDTLRAKIDAYEARKAPGKLEDKRRKVLDGARKAPARHLLQTALAPRMSATLQQSAWRDSLAALQKQAGAASTWAAARLEAAAARAWTEQLRNSPSVRSWARSLDTAFAARDRGELAGFYCGIAELWEAAAGATDAHTAQWAVDMARRWLAHDLGAPEPLEALTRQAPQLRISPQSFFWDLLQELAKGDQHLPLLARAAHAHPALQHAGVLQTGPGLPRAEALRALEQRRWEVGSWTWHNGQDLFCLQGAADAQRETPPIYELSQTSHSAVLGHLQTLAEGGWQVLGLSCDAARQTLHLLVRAGDGADAAPSYGFMEAADAAAALDALERRGAQVRGYAQTPDKFCGRKHLFVVDYSPAKPMEHKLVGQVARAGLPETLARRAAEGWRVAGVAQEDGSPVTLLLARPLGDAALPPAQRLRDASLQAASAQVRQALVAHDFPRAQAALQALSAYPPEAGLWPRHAAALSAALQLLPEQPWVASAQLGALAASAPTPPTAESRRFTAALQRLVEDLLARELAAARIPALCEDAEHTPLDGAAEAWILQRLARAATPDAPAPEPLTATALLRHMVQHAAIGAATVLVALHADADADDCGAPTARRMAVESGIPALSEALEGNVHAAAEWARLGRVQRQAIVDVGKAAVALSDAARPELEARLAALGLQPDDVLVLRRHVARQAPLWINFDLTEKNLLLGDVVYHPRGTGRARYAGEYDDAGERRVIYSWLNAVNSVQGYTAFGDGVLELQHRLRARATLLARKDTEKFTNVGTFHAMDHVLARMSDGTLQTMHHAATRRLGGGGFGVSDDREPNIIEVHVHGPLLLSHDARAVRVRFGTVTVPAVLAKLQGFAQRNGLPLQWHGYGAAKDAQARADILPVAGASGVDLAAVSMTSSYAMTVPRLNRVAKPGQYSYAVHCERFARARQLVALLGREGLDIVGFGVDTPSNQVAKRGKQQVKIIARRDLQDSAPRTYLWQQTFLLGERLRQLEANGWEVVAYQQVAAAGHSTPEHLLIARATPGASFEHEVLFEESTDATRLRPAVYRQVAMAAEQGAELAGLHLEEASATLLFKTPRPPRAEAPEDTDDTDGAVTLLGEPLATLPAALRFQTEAGRHYDIDELVALIASKGRFVDALSQPLSEADAQRIILHPSGAGRHLASLGSDLRAQQRLIRPATRAQILAVVAALRADPTDGALPASTLALAAFRQHVASCAPEEQVALHGAQFTCIDTHRAVFTVTVMEAMAALQTGAGCSRATADYLSQMAQTLETVAARGA